MPTVLRDQGFEVRIYPGDHEPPHVHVVKAGAEIKVELHDLGLIRNWGMSTRDVNRAVALVETHRAYLEEAFHRLAGEI